ncbi:MAG TPA: hypothetical protein VFW35_03175 [Sphingomicrobium sp.]|nr:hypothetical protein [Sphingomicrobium sp.]
MLSWGSNDVRVHAAMAFVSLSPRFAAENDHIVDQLDALLSDPVPAVRLQVARNLQVLCIAAPDRMWTMARRFIIAEMEPEILASFLAHPLHVLSTKNPEACEEIVEGVIARMPVVGASDRGSRDTLQEALGNIVARLRIVGGRATAERWFASWTEDLVRYGSALKRYLSWSKRLLFARYKADATDEDRAVSTRAQADLQQVVEKALTLASASLEAFSAEGITDEAKEAAVKSYRAAEELIILAMNQFYFGSGAHTNASEPFIGLSTADAMRSFLDDYAATLDALARSNEPRTHYHLVELYEYLMPGDPARVFDAIHALLLGQAKREGFQFETLGQGAVIRVVQRYLADHRAIFEDEGRREKLVEILQLFADVGWPQALKLLYDLPDLLR